jgi:cytochrome P450
MTVITVSGRSDVLNVLESAALVPPVIDAAAPHGVLRLQHSMARFSGPAVHASRRDDVVAVIERLDTDACRAAAARLTEQRLGPHRIDVVGHVARAVPTETLIELLGLEYDIGQALADVDRIADVIGRGASPTAATDEAARRLMSAATRAGADPIAVVSVLYQSFDSTAALFLTTLHASCSGEPAVPAVPRTRRVASHDTVVGHRRIGSGTVVIVEIGSAGLPFGAGAHRCPGESVARCVVAGMLDAVHAWGYEVDARSVVTDVDGRPVRMAVVRSRERLGTGQRDGRRTSARQP